MNAPTALAVRRMTRRAQRANVPGGLADKAMDVYIVVLAIGFVVATVVSSVHRTPTPATLHAPQGATWILIVALTLLLAGAALLLFSAVGPMSVGAPAQTWQLSTPSRRSSWLAPRLVWLLLATAGIGVVLGGLIELATAKGLVPAGNPTAGRSGLAWGAGIGALIAVVLAAGAVAGQPRGARITAIIGRVLLGLGLAASVSALVVSRTESATTLVFVDARFGPLSALIGAIVLAVLGVGVVRALSRLDRAALSTGADLTNSAAVAVVGLDPSMLAGAVQLRRLRRIGKVRGRRLGATSRHTALLAAERRRLLRHPAAVVSYFALMLAPYLAGIILGPALVTLVRVLAAYIAAYGLAGGLRAVARSAPLRRALGGTDADLRLTHLVAPALGAAIWLAATATVGRALSLEASAVVFVGVLAAVYRTASRQPINYETAWATSPLGPLPVGLLAQSLKGLDLALVVAALTAYWPGSH